MPRSLAGFIKQSLYVGYGLMCSAFIDTWYTTSYNLDKVANCQRTVAPSMTHERRAIYEIFVLLETHVNKKWSPFSCGYVLSIKNRMTVDLKRDKLER